MFRWLSGKARASGPPDREFESEGGAIEFRALQLKFCSSDSTYGPVLVLQPDAPRAFNRFERGVGIEGQDGTGRPPREGVEVSTWTLVRARGRREFAPSEFAGNITCRIPVASSSKKSKKMKYSPNKPF